MTKLVINDVTSGYYSTTALNAAFTAIETAMENTVSRDGTAPNQMEADLDMNSNRITNLPAPGNVNEPARLQDLLDAAGGLGSTTASLVSASATTNNAALTVQGQLNNLGESTGAASVGNTPAGNIAATTVQAAINELDSEKQPLNANLTTLTAFTTDTDGALTANSDVVLATQKATKTYADTKNIAIQVVPTTAGNVLFTADGAAWTSVAKITSSTAIATTSGTSHDFTSIPSWVKRITVMFTGVSTNGTSPVIIQLGDAGGIEATGYAGSATYATTVVATSSITTGLGVTNTGIATDVRNGSVTISKLDGNMWVSSGVVSSSGTATHFAAGSKTLSDVLTQLRITTVVGTDTFDAGSVNITYE